MRAIVKRRDDVVRTGWRSGLGSWARAGTRDRGDPPPLLTDTLSREIDEFARVLDRTLTAVSRAS